MYAINNKRIGWMRSLVFSSGMIMLLAFGLVRSNLAAPGGPNDIQFDFKVDGVQSVRSGGSLPLQVEVRIPENRHIYLENLSSLSFNIVTEFQTADNSGWAIEVSELPRGEKKEHDMILSGRGLERAAGTYKLNIFETLGRDVGDSVIPVTIKIKTQMCNTETNICYRPVEMSKTLSFKVDQPRERFAPVSHRGGVNWITSFDEAKNKARQSGQNIFVVITAPEWCGYCVQLERNVFSKNSVHSTLNTKFIPLRILDSNADKNKFNFSGYPTMIVMNAGGSEFTRSIGRNESAFLNALKPYEKEAGGNNDNTTDTGGGGTYTYTQTIEGKFIHNGNGRWEMETPYGENEECEEIKRSDRYIILRSRSNGTYYAVPSENGKAYVYVDGKWEEHSTVSVQR